MSDKVREGRLLMVVHSTVPDDPRVMSEARAARDAGFEVDIVALRGDAEFPEEQLEERIHGVEHGLIVRATSKIVQELAAKRK